jgi:DNA-binding LacI/PurR family transcriptional regulator
VSNVVNDMPHVREATRRRVLTAIEELGYSPNISARRLKQGRTNILGLAVPELSQPYFAELFERIESVARERGYTLIATQTHGAKAEERRVLAEFTSHFVDGLIFSPMSMGAAELSRTPLSVPLVLIGEQISGARHPAVAIDNTLATRDITRVLLDQGCRRLAALGAFRSSRYRSSRLRLAGYRQALIQAGIEPLEELVFHTDEFSRAAGLEAVRQALADGVQFDAIVCFTDMLATGALRALADAGLKVPTDVALASIDDVQESAYTVPSLTTVRPDKSTLARCAVETLVELITDPDTVPGTREIPYEVVIRESSHFTRAASRCDPRVPLVNTVSLPSDV